MIPATGSELFILDINLVNRVENIFKIVKADERDLVLRCLCSAAQARCKIEKRKKFFHGYRIYGQPKLLLLK